MKKPKMKSFKSFVRTIEEALHPDLMRVIASPSKADASYSDTESTSQQKRLFPKDSSDKRTRIGNVIAKLQEKGEKLGTNPRKTPSGSSRRWFGHSSAKYHAIVDGIRTKLATGIKTAIPHYDLDSKGKLSAGQLQNKVENTNKKVNSKYRILTHVGKEKDLFGHSYDKFETNREHGIFPPLLNYDHENHEWAHVGHVYDINRPDRNSKKPHHLIKNTFRNLTITKHHPEGISEMDFLDGIRAHKSASKAEIDKDGNMKGFSERSVNNHPLVKKFGHYLRNVKGAETEDFLGPNLGIFVHPHTGEKHIIARDHGYDAETHKLYWG